MREREKEQTVMKGSVHLEFSAGIKWKIRVWRQWNKLFVCLHQECKSERGYELQTLKGIQVNLLKCSQ